MSKRRSNGPAIRAIREAVGVPGSIFATRCLISHAYLNNIERERKYPPTPVLQRIAGELGVSLDAISYVLPECPTCEAAA